MPDSTEFLQNQIADLNAAQKATEHRAAFECLLGRLAGDLMVIPAEHAATGLSRAIAPIALFMKMQLAAICIFNRETQKIELRSRWRTPTISSTQSTLDRLPMGAYPSLIAHLEKRELYILEDTQLLPDHLYSLKLTMEELGARSLVLIPMVTSEQTIGFLALAGTAPRKFDPQEFASLTTTAQIIANVLQRMDRDSALKKQEAELEAILAASDDGLLVFDNMENVILTNRRFAELFHFDTPPEKGTPVSDISTAMTRLLAEETSNTILRIDNERDAQTNADKKWCLADGRCFTARRRPFLKQNCVVGQIWSFRDITVEYNLELRLQQSQKLESIGRLASGIAHDFNNILFTITSICDVRLNKPDITKRDEKDFSGLKDAAERAAKLTRQLLAFSRRQVLSIATVSMNDVVRGMVSMLHRLIGENISVILALNAKKDVIRADPHQLEQVILNLVINARDAMPDGGRLTLETLDVVVEPRESRRRYLPPVGEYLQLRVTDTGHGMNDETITRIFEPFFTTKQVGRGTGLGLSMVYGIVKQHGGHVTASSRLGEGTTLDIYLPRDEGESRAEENRISLLPLARGSGETVLLVEDDEILRESTSLMLCSQGYNVLQAAHGEEALTLAEMHTVDLLLTDVVMPELGGVELYANLRRKFPGLPVVFLSGFGGDDEGLKTLLDEGHALLQKPVRMPVLLKALRNALSTDRN